jgi:uncharacterized protein (UPF0548 family)
MGRVEVMSAGEAGRLRREQFTYVDVGATASTYHSGFPDGYHVSHHHEVIGHGRGHFERAAERLMTWRMHSDAGLRVRASSAAARDAVVVCRLGPGRLSLRIPCRVIYVVEEPDRRGFGYGTLPGHPESGEESFLVAIEDDVVTLTVTAFSRPGLLVTRLGGPVSRWLQGRALRRYAAVLR